MLGGGESRLFLGPPEINFCRRHLDRAREGETGLSRSVGETDIRRSENNISLSPRSVNPVSLANVSFKTTLSSVSSSHLFRRSRRQNNNFSPEASTSLSPNFDPSSRAGKHGMILLLDRVSYLDQPAPVVCGI